VTKSKAFSSLLNKTKLVLFPQLMLGIKTAALPGSLRRTNQRTIVSLLMRMASASRADLAKAAGISQPTAGKIISEMLRLGVLQDVPPQTISLASQSAQTANPRLGRPGKLVALNRDQSRFLAIALDVGETTASALPIAICDEELWGVRFATPGSVPLLAKRLRESCAAARRTDLWGVIVSVPGIVDEIQGKILYSPNVHWLENADLVGTLRRHWSVPVLLVQEIRALALGRLATNPECGDFLLVDFGHGVGGAVVSEGKLQARPGYFEGEVGHTPIAGLSRLCGCGGVGCLETLASQRGLLESFSATHSIVAPTWPQLVEHVNRHGMEPWLVETARHTARVIAGALNVTGIRHVVVTGVLNEMPQAVKFLSDEVTGGALCARFGKVSCESAPRRRAAGLVAAGLDRLVFPSDNAKPPFKLALNSRSSRSRHF
jgi:predicted NBD/HSP70 family sugar kinase